MEIRKLQKQQRVLVSLSALITSIIGSQKQEAISNAQLQWVSFQTLCRDCVKYDNGLKHLNDLTIIGAPSDLIAIKLLAKCIDKLVNKHYSGLETVYCVVE